MPWCLWGALVLRNWAYPLLRSSLIVLLSLLKDGNKCVGKHTEKDAKTNHLYVSRNFLYEERFRALNCRYDWGVQVGTKHKYRRYRLRIEYNQERTLNTDLKLRN